jgi:hypothetical protein
MLSINLFGILLVSIFDQISIFLSLIKLFLKALDMQLHLLLALDMGSAL